MSFCKDRSADLLPEFVHGLLSSGEETLVEKHLESCPECAREIRVLRELEQEILPEPPRWFWTSLPEKVTARIESSRKRRKRMLIPAWVGGLAAASVIAFMFIVPGPAPQLPTDLMKYEAALSPGPVSLGLEEDIIGVSGTFEEDLEDSLDLEDTSDIYLYGMEPIREGYGFEMMDENTIGVFEDLLEEMTLEKVGRKVIS